MITRHRPVPLACALAAGALLLVFTACRDTGADDGEPAGGAITIWTDSTELFMEHPALIVGDSGRFAVHLTDLTDFAPLTSGQIVLRFVPGGGGEPVVAVQDTPRAPGIYGPAPVFARPGVYDLTILVDSPQARDSITVGALRVYATAADAPREEESAEPGFSFLKEQQWKTPGFRTVFADTGYVTASIDATGEIVPVAGRFAAVTAPIGGLVDAAGVATAPAPGQRVARGQVLASLVPALGEGGSAYAEARARLREAQDEYDRAKRLYEVEAVPQRRVHEAEIRLQAAREALAGFGGGQLTAGGRIPVRAPIAGVIAERSISAGSNVAAGQPLFTIVDPSTVWLRVSVPADQAPQVGLTAGAIFRLDGGERLYRARRMVSSGSVIESASRTLPVLFEVPNPDGSIRIGSTARVSLLTGTRVMGVVIPVSAVLDEDGRPVAYVQLDGERFEKRDLLLGGREGDVVLVQTGVAAGERVVTGAAYQVRLASLSTAVPAHGHEH
jgi:membrane fusion protein, heavy metal efflux system